MTLNRIVSHMLLVVQQSPRIILAVEGSSGDLIMGKRLQKLGDFIPRYIDFLSYQNDWIIWSKHLLHLEPSTKGEDCACHKHNSPVHWSVRTNAVARTQWITG